jgi:hypothetical protein
VEGGYTRVTMNERDQAEWNREMRGETDLERIDRNYNDLLQELRVTQTGVQILFAFLLTLAFTQRFTEITSFQRTIYVTTLLCAAAATALIIAPVSYHRIVFRRRLKPRLVRAANRFAIGGLGFLVIAMSGSVLLIVDVVLDGSIVAWLAGGTAGWFVFFWYLVPLWARLTSSESDRES